MESYTFFIYSLINFPYKLLAFISPKIMNNTWDIIINNTEMVALKESLQDKCNRQHYCMGRWRRVGELCWPEDVMELEDYRGRKDLNSVG